MPANDPPVQTSPASAPVAGATANLGPARSVDELIERIKTPDDTVRGPAWQNADRFGSEAVVPLITTMADPAFETARCARRALWKIVRASGRPGAESVNRAVEKELIAALSPVPLEVCRELLWMLSETGGDASVPAVARLLENPELRDDARCALTRLPGKKATAALKSAMAHAPDPFKFALAESLRTRGVAVAGYPSPKRVPTKKTNVVQVQTPTP